MKSYLITIALVFACLIGWAQYSTLLHVNVTDMVYDQSRNKVFALIGSIDSLYPNRLIQIDCNTKEVENSVYVGSNPDIIALTSDFNHVYIALAGSPKIVKVDLVTFEIELEFPIGPIGNSLDIYAQDMVTIKGHPDLLAVSRKEGIIIEDNVLFNNGELLPESVSSFQIKAESMVCDSTGEMLIACDGNDFGRLLVEDSGLYYYGSYDDLIEGQIIYIEYSEGLVYASSGQVANPHTNIPVASGKFENIEIFSIQAINQTLNEIYFGVFDNETEAFRVTTFNINTHELKSVKEMDLGLPIITQVPLVDDFICYGNGKYVVSVRDLFNQEYQNYIVFIDSLVDNTPWPNGANDISVQTLDVYPNPTVGKFHVNLGKDYQNATVTLSDMKGQIIQTESNHESQFIDLELDAPAGIYLVNVSSNEMNTTVRLIKH